MNYETQLEHVKNFTEQQISEMFLGFINQRPNIETIDYGGDDSACKQDRNTAWRQKIDALKTFDKFCRYIELFGLDQKVLAEALHYAFSGRLTLKNKLHYCAGQYMPTEYRMCIDEVMKFYISKSN